MPGGKRGEAPDLVVRGQFQDDGDERLSDTERGELIGGVVGEERARTVRYGLDLLGNGVRDILEVDVVDRSGDAVDAVRQPVDMLVDVLAVLDGDEQPVVVRQAQEQRAVGGVLPVDPRGPQASVLRVLSEVEAA